MTSHIRHRRDYDPAAVFPSPIEPGEIAINTSNRQLIAGDANPASAGSKIPLLAVRYFDARAQYVVNDYVVQGGGLYRAKVTITPAAFDATKWDTFSTDAAAKAYVDAGDAAVTTAFQAADATLTTSVNGKVNKAGDVMTGFLTLVAATPTNAFHATSKQYVDQQILSGGLGVVTATNVTYAPGGSISSTNVQAAITELDTEKASLSAPQFVGVPTAASPPLNQYDGSVATTAWVAGQASTTQPAMDGFQQTGSSLHYSREDHVHPSDTSRAPLASPDFSGIPTAPTAAIGTNSRQLATTAFVLANTAPADGSITFAKLANSAVATIADYLGAVASKLLTADRVWAAAVPVALVDSATVAPNLSQGVNFVWTLGGYARTLANPSNPKPGQAGFIYLVQDSLGGRYISVWDTMYKFPGGTKPTMSSAPNAVDILSYSVKSGTEVECTFVAGMA